MWEKERLNIFFSSRGNVNSQNCSTENSNPTPSLMGYELRFYWYSKSAKTVSSLAKIMDTCSSGAILYFLLVRWRFLWGSICQLDVNRCRSSPCQNGGICVNALGTFTCTCSGPGYKGKWHVHTLWCWNILPWSYLHSLSKGNLFPLRWLQTLLPSACRVLLGSFAASSVANHVFSCGDSNCPFCQCERWSAPSLVEGASFISLWLIWWKLGSDHISANNPRAWLDIFYTGIFGGFCAPVRLDCVHLSKQVSEVYCFGIGVCVC